MINACAQAHDAERAARWFSAIQSRGLRPNRISFGTLIGSHAKLGNVAQAEELSRKMSEAGLQKDEVVYNSLINACAKAGEQQKAEQWLRTMLSEGISPNQKAYSGLIQACVRSNDLAKAEEWFECMEEAGGTPDLIAFSSMIHVAAKIGTVKKAEYWMSRMISYGITPNVVCFNTLLHAFARSGAYKPAVEWVARMRTHNVTPNRITLNTMMHASIIGGGPKDTEHWLQCMVQGGIRPDKVTLSTLLMKRSGTPVSAERLQWAFEAVARAYEAVGDRHSAEVWRRGQMYKDLGEVRGEADSPHSPWEQPEQGRCSSGSRRGPRATGVRRARATAAAAATPVSHLCPPGSSRRRFRAPSTRRSCATRGASTGGRHRPGCRNRDPRAGADWATTRSGSIRYTICRPRSYHPPEKEDEKEVEEK
jgi:pentatricopeptide repeat protein